MKPHVVVPDAHAALALGMHHPEIQQPMTVVPVQSRLAQSASWLSARREPDFEASGANGTAQGL
jgi:hypothetical protein